MMLYGRPIPNDEMMKRLQDITCERLTDLAGRLFFETVPTLSAIGPLEKLASLTDITSALSVPHDTQKKATG
jgi:predicted Zn-dependent peptidase